MLRKIIILFFIILNILTLICYADNVDLEIFPAEEIWEEIQNVNNQINSNPPKLNSRAAIIFDRESKTVIFGKNINEKRAMASTTKIMTAIVTLEKGNLNDVIEVSKKAANIGGSRLGLNTGDKIKLKDLLYGLLLRSGNDAAIQIALHIGGSVEGFAQLMNDKAKELGLENTHFITPHGLDNPNHYTTAYELALLTDYALNIEEFAKIVNTKQTTISINSNPVTITNTNELLGNLDGVNGVKTGFTNIAGRCLVTSVKRNDWNIITIVLGADTKKYRTKDSIELIEYNYKNFERINIKEKIEEEFENWKNNNLNDFEIIKGKQNSVNIDMNYSYYFDLYPINKAELSNIKIQIECSKTLEAPIKDNYQIGQIHVILSGKEIMNIPIITTGSIDKKGVLDYFEEIIGNYTNIIINNINIQADF